MAQSYEDINLEDFIELMQDVYYLGGFEEIETGKVINAYDSIAKVFQSFTTLDSEGNVGADITSYQMEFLTTDGGLQMCFGLPIPMRF